MTKKRREKFLLENRGLVHWTVKKLLRRLTLPPSVERSDVVQEGFLGLLHACDKFDPAKGAFATYASYWIRVFVQKYLQRNASITSGFSLCFKRRGIFPLDVHLDGAVCNEDGESYTIDLEDTRAGLAFSRYEDREFLEACVKRAGRKIGKRGPDVLARRYLSGREETFEQIGKEWRKSRETVRLAEEKALTALRDIAAEAA